MKMIFLPIVAIDVRHQQNFGKINSKFVMSHRYSPRIHKVKFKLYFYENALEK